MWAWKCIIWDYRLPGSTLRPRLTRGLFWCLFTGPLWGESTTHRWILITKGHQCGAFWISSLLSCTRTVEHSVELPSMVDPIWMRPGCGLAVFSTQSALLRWQWLSRLTEQPLYTSGLTYMCLLLYGFLLLQWRPSINIIIFSLISKISVEGHRYNRQTCRCDTRMGIVDKTSCIRDFFGHPFDLLDKMVAIS